MYCQDICGTLFPLLHTNCAMLELLIMCNGLGVSCHSLINHFAITMNVYHPPCSGPGYPIMRSLEFPIN